MADNPTPNLDQEFDQEDAQAKDPEAGNKRRQNFKDSLGGDEGQARNPGGQRPDAEPSSPPPDTREPYREPKSDDKPGQSQNQ